MVFHSILLLKFPLANSLLSFTPILSFTLSLSLSLASALSFFSHSLSLFYSLSLSGKLFSGFFRLNLPLWTAHKVFTLISVRFDRADRAAYLMLRKLLSRRPVWKLSCSLTGSLLEASEGKAHLQLRAYAKQIDLALKCKCSNSWPRAVRGRLLCRLLGLCATPTACQVATLVWHSALRGFQSAVYVGEPQAVCTSEYICVWTCKYVCVYVCVPMYVLVSEIVSTSEAQEPKTFLAMAETAKHNFKSRFDIYLSFHNDDNSAIFDKS